MDAIQLETPKHLRNKEASLKYAKDIAVTIQQYVQLYYETEIRKQAQLWQFKKGENPLKLTITVI